MAGRKKYSHNKHNILESCLSTNSDISYKLISVLTAKQQWERVKALQNRKFVIFSDALDDCRRSFD